MKKRFLSLILATTMVFSLLSTTAFATETVSTNELPTSEGELPTMDIRYAVKFCVSDIRQSQGWR